MARKRIWGRGNFESPLPKTGPAHAGADSLLQRKETFLGCLSQGRAQMWRENHICTGWVLRGILGHWEPAGWGTGGGKGRKVSLLGGLLWGRHWLRRLSGCRDTAPLGMWLEVAQEEEEHNRRSGDLCSLLTSFTPCSLRRQNAYGR